MGGLASIVDCLKQWMDEALDLIFPKPRIEGDLKKVQPPFCERCCQMYEHSSIQSSFECSNCMGRDWTLSRARAAYLSDGVVRDSIHAFKYNQQFYHLRFLSDWLEEGFDLFYKSELWDMLVPVPLYIARQRKRGYNQALELAKMLSRRCRIPVQSVLTRKKDTATQTHLRRSERLKNMKGAFEIKSGKDVRGMKILLIDDVLTSGATADSCARVLTRAGAKEVCLLTVARG